MDFMTLCFAVLVIKTARIVRNPTLECYMRVKFKQGSVKHRLGSRSGHKGKVILTIIEVCIYGMCHVFQGGIFGVEFDGDTYFLYE